MTPLELGLKRIKLYDGVYKRVAEQLGVHPSLVSRVAKGERNSSEVHAALIDELERIENQLRAGAEALHAGSDSSETDFSESQAA